MMAVLAIATMVLAGCREADGPLGGSTGQLIVSSDPEGGLIYLDDEPTGYTTPDTVPNVGGSHTVLVVKDTGGGRFSYAARVIVQGIEPLHLSGPLTARCGASDQPGSCFNRNRQLLVGGNLQISLNALGAMMLEDGSGQGLMWPTGTLDSYVSNAMPLIAAKVEGRGVALGMYDIQTMAGRPAPSVTVAAGGLLTDLCGCIVVFI